MHPKLHDYALVNTCIRFLKCAYSTRRISFSGYLERKCSVPCESVHVFPHILGMVLPWNIYTLRRLTPTYSHTGIAFQLGN